jgi:hypothetical protein
MIGMLILKPAKLKYTYAASQSNCIAQAAVLRSRCRRVSRSQVTNLLSATIFTKKHVLLHEHLSASLVWSQQ